LIEFHAQEEKMMREAESQARAKNPSLSIAYRAPRQALLQILHVEDAVRGFRKDAPVPGKPHRGSRPIFVRFLALLL